MDYRIIKISYPADQGFVKAYLSKIPDSAKNIYESVDFFEKNIFPDKVKLATEKTKEKNPLGAVINLHNKDGIKNIQQIRDMIRQIDSGRHVLQASKLPNIKLVITKKNEFILFDGHHSLLAYMKSGRRYLSEVPHLIVINQEGYVTDREILAFFGQHSAYMADNGWRRYVVNWQAPKEKQICRRKEKDMGELLKSISVYL